MEEQRETYGEIRQRAFESAYSCCRSRLSKNRVIRPGETDDGFDMFARFFDGTHEVMEEPLLELMFRSLELMLFVGSVPPAHRAYNVRIAADILNRHGFDDLVKDIPQDEADELRTDLELLGLLPDRAAL